MSTESDSLAATIESFLENGFATHGGITICRDPESAWRICVLSFTDAPDGVIPSDDEAEEKISDSKDLFERLCSESQEFVAAVGEKVVAFEFCRDRGDHMEVFAAQESQGSSGSS